MIQYEKKYEDILKVGIIREKDVTKWEPSFSHQIKKDEYVKRLDQVAHEATTSFFSILIKLLWLEDAMKYSNKNNKKANGAITKKNLISYMFRGLAGHEISYVLKTERSWLEKYAYDFFPRFKKDDPFSDPDKYKYPYSHVTLEFLRVVYQMPQRFELLDYAEEKKMKYVDFVNYVVNFIHCYNDERGKRKFSIFWKEQPWHKIYIKNDNY